MMQSGTSIKYVLAPARRSAGWLIQVFLLAMLAGCAAGTSHVEMEAGGRWPASVTRLTEGRQGFVIQETATLDGDLRREFARGVGLLQEQKYEEAVEALAKVIAAEPGVTAPYVDIGRAYAGLEKYEEAEKHLQTALRLVPDHPAASNEYGLLLRKNGRFAEARTVYEKTLARFPEYLPAHRNLGILCDLYLNDQVCALEQYELYSAAMPGDEQVKMWIAELKMRAGR